MDMKIPKDFDVRKEAILILHMANAAGGSFNINRTCAGTEANCVAMVVAAMHNQPEVKAVVLKAVSVFLENPGLSVSLVPVYTDFELWKTELITVAARALGVGERTIKISDQQAKEWYDSGATPWQCFRENWDSDGD